MGDVVNVEKIAPRNGVGERDMSPGIASAHSNLAVVQQSRKHR